MRRVYTLLAVASWLLLLAFGLIKQFYSMVGIYKSIFPQILQGLLLNGFIFATYFALKNKIDDQEDIDISKMLWEDTATALVTIGVSGVLWVFILVIIATPLEDNIFLHHLLFNIQFALMLVFMLTLYVRCRKMVQYQSNQFTTNLFTVFEVLLAFATLEHLFFVDDLSGGYINILFLIFGICIAFFSINVRWIAELTIRQKIVSLLQLWVIAGALGYFMYIIASYFSQEALVITELASSVFFYTVYGFVFIYLITSSLVIIFNLPTSSVFERKFKEVEALQDLSESILDGKTEENAYNVLIERTMQTVRADIGWIETDKQKIILHQNTPYEVAADIQEFIKKQGYDQKQIMRIFDRQKLAKKDEFIDYHSILAVPLATSNSFIGTLYLANHKPNYYKFLSSTIIKTFATQASVAIHNFKLVEQAIEAERYKSELSIAQNLQQRLLPTGVNISDKFEFFAKSLPATEVGGDYYDIFKINDNLYAVIIADIAGHGITAAFSMAQLKGIFQSLVLLVHTPADFLKYTNAALSVCLEKSVFVTASYLLINTEAKTINMARAGHCDTIYYAQKEQKLSIIPCEGLGLGIIRDNSYHKYIETVTKQYQKGDLLFLYTDGIVETMKNNSKELYGDSRLLSVINEHIDQPLALIYDAIMTDLTNFRGKNTNEDDCTFLFIKM
jgi:serine phosphatase RsbU (regulator of sigma subunit)